MVVKRIPPRRTALKIAFSFLLLAFFQNVCLGGQWTMMFYMAADNDLYSQALTDIKELQRISGQPGIEILVQLDSPSGAFRYRVQPQGISILASLGQINSGSSGPLTDFGSWSVKMYPAQKYLLVLWDHGDGWSKKGKGIGIDGPDYLSVAEGELRQAVAGISAAAGQPLDLVVFDACSMQMVEVLMELDGLCRYAVGSESLFPIEGMPYDLAWKDIQGGTPAESLAVWLVNSCGSFGAGYQTTCSAVDITSLSLSAQSLKLLAAPFRLLPIGAILDPVAVSDSVLSFPPWDSYDLAEVLDFMGTRLPEPERTGFLEAGRQLKKSVLARVTVGDQYQKAAGLAVWYPGGKYSFEGGIELYRRMRWSGLSGWDRVLQHLIFQKDSLAEVPQKTNLSRGPGDTWHLAWEPGYEPSGIASYQVRHSQSLITDFSDHGGSADSVNWIKEGFTISPRDDGDTAYYSIGGEMTLKDKVRFDASGNIGFWADGSWGSLILEFSSDTTAGWDTLGTWNWYRNSGKKYCSAKTKNITACIRFSWKPFSGGYRVFIDDIKACHPDTGSKVEVFETVVPFHTLNTQPGSQGFYQVRTIDSLQNASPWGKDVYHYQDAGCIRPWPNPFTKKVFLLFSAPATARPDVKVYNILGQYIDRIPLQKMEMNGGEAEYLFCWEPRAALAGGVYFARVNSGRSGRTIKMILIR